MIYREFSPPPALKDDVLCFWLVQGAHGAPAAIEESLVPDGCVEWIVHHGDCFVRNHEDGSQERQPASLIAGVTNRPVRVNPTGSVGMVGVRFRLGRARHFFPMPWSDLINGIISPADASLTRFAETSRQVRDTGDPHHKFDLMAECLLRARLHANGSDDSIDHALNLLQTSNGLMDTAKLARQAGVTTRTLERRFKTAVGVGPKELSRIVRFRAIFDQIERGQYVDWSYVAAASGFFDQPHLIRDFKQFAGCTPTEFLRRRQSLSHCLAGL